MDIKDKVIVITGGSSGIGRETAIRLSRKGAKIVLAARSLERLTQVRDIIEGITKQAPLTIPCDIASDLDVSRLAEIIRDTYSGVDVLVNCAGIGTYRASESISNQEMRRHFEINFFGAYYCIKALLPLMRLRNGAYILNIGSVFGKWVPFPEASVYAASKFALRGFSEGLRRELKPSSIGVGYLMPGPVNTPFQGKKDGERRTPSFLMIEPSDVAKTIENMIRRRKKEAIIPKWIAPLFWMRSVIS